MLGKMTLGLELLGWDPGAQLLTFLPPAQPRFPRSLGNLNDTEGSIPQPLLGWPLILGLLSPTWEPPREEPPCPGSPPAARHGPPPQAPVTLPATPPQLRRFRLGKLRLRKAKLGLAGVPQVNT